MSVRTLPLLFLNLGGEMLYILDQRLRAQNIPGDKARRGERRPGARSQPHAPQPDPLPDTHSQTHAPQPSLLSLPSSHSQAFL